MPLKRQNERIHFTIIFVTMAYESLAKLKKFRQLVRVDILTT